MRRAGATVLLASLAGCAGSAPATDTSAGSAAIMLADSAVLTAPAATPTTAPAVMVLDGSGQPVAGAEVTFSTSNGAWVTASHALTDSAGRAATTWVLGPMPGVEYRLVASAGAVTAEFRAAATPVPTGMSIFGAHDYVEFVPGALPVIISVPHGGSLMPESVPDRTGAVVTVRDAHTMELADDIARALARRTGRAPSLVISRLHRRKLDPNRDIIEAAQGDPMAERAWREYHGFIEAARAALVAAGSPGLYIDLHGHGHEAQRVELGYLINARELALSDATLNERRLVNRSSLRALLDSGDDAARTHAALIRGPSSLGSLLDARGFPAVPSAAIPDPGLAPFYAGGYSVARHASRDGALIAGLQLEANLRVRDSPARRQAFADAVAAALLDFMAVWQAQTSLRAVAGGR